MAAVDIVRDYVPDRIFKRGKRYYNSGKIKAYRIKPGITGNYEILATVMGTYKYEVGIEIKFVDDDLYFDGYCNCPYDWGNMCKHQVAVLYKFFTQDYLKIKKREKDPVAELEKLALVSKAVTVVASPVLKYYIKGLMTNNMVNFKITLKSDQLSDESLATIISYLHNPHYFVPYMSRLGGKDSDTDIYAIKQRLKYKDLGNIEYLKKSETKKSQTTGAILFPKNSSNFNFLLNLIRESEVYLDETGEKAEVGEELYPELVISGNEDNINIETKSEFRVYRSDNLTWMVIDSIVHPFNGEIVSDLPEQLQIPEENKGKFLFEILPALQENMSLHLSENLAGYEVIKREPDIQLEFDYREETILCDLQVKIDEKIYDNAEILGINKNKRAYERSTHDNKLWFSWDTDTIKRLINFLEDSEFHVTQESFVIRDKNDIQEFITDGFIHIPEEWEITTTPAFDEVEIMPVELEPVIEFKADDGENINWFEFTITYNLGGKTYSREEIMELLQYNRQGEAYLYLDDKYYIIQESEKEKKVKDALQLADESDDGSYRSNYYNLLYYRNLLEESGLSFSGNKVYDELNQDITGDNLIKKVKVPGEVKDKLRDYQKEGYYWLRFLHKYHFGGILADDMGLGKTIQSLTFIRGISAGGPALIICPRTLIYNWGEEIKKFFPDTNYLVYYGTPDEREEMRTRLEDYEVIITSYSIISRDYEELNDYRFSYCILDEAQHIKNHKTLRAKAVKSITAGGRLALTGTPIENSIEELWSIFDFLMSGYLGNFNQFKQEYLQPVKKDNNQEKLIELKNRVAPFILRRKKEEVLQELPKKIINIHQVEMTKLQEDTYRAILTEVKNKLTETVRKKGFNKSQINDLSSLTKLRQLCNHPRLVLDNIDQKLSSGKMNSLQEIVEDAIAGEHKLVIFSQFVKMLKLIRERFKKTGINFEYLDGSTRNRMERVKHFNQAENIPVFLISLKAGGTGLNLTAADIVIHIDPWWNPMVERQATDRTHRIGQEKRVIVYKLITAGTVEEKMLKLQERKKSIFENVIENNTDPMEGITWEDIQELLEYN